MPIPFDKYNYLKLKDLERNPYPMWTKQSWEWGIDNDRRMLLIALDRYADEISMKNDEYRCAYCGGIFKYIRDETWSEDKANEEYRQKFPGESMENRDVVCDDCWQIVRPDRNYKPKVG